MIDLRSDTVTLPTPEMREAIARAELGDDVYGEDPTVNRLETMAAAAMGKEAALLVASGTMGNLIGMLVHCARGTKAVLGARAHTYLYEAGGAAALGGVVLTPMRNTDDGEFDLDELESEVFEANQQITRQCESCNEGTVWQRAPHDLPGGNDKTVAEQKKERAELRVWFSGTKNDRKHVRVQMKISACIRQPGFQGEEVVPVMNISRGGLCFVSGSVYFPGSNLEVAAPFTKGAANVFVPSRVVRVEKLDSQKLTKYGVAYLRDPRG